MKSRQDGQVARLAESLAEARKERDDMRERLKDSINKRLAEHTMYTPSDELFQVGWSTPTIRFWCERCRTPWPCKTFHDLKAIYGETTQWGGDLTEYAPLELKRKPTKPAKDSS